MSESVKPPKDTGLHCHVAREPRTIFVGATPNGNEKVGGWLPFVVDLSPVYKTMRVYGTLYTDYELATCQSKGSALMAARAIAVDTFASECDSVEEVEGCHRCWDDRDPRHIENVNGQVRCGTCQRVFKSA